MDYYALLDIAVDLGYELAMAGAETYRIEESVVRMLQTYGLQAQVFAIPNNLTVSIETPEGKPMTMMRRIGHHGNDLDSVDQFSAMSRAIVNRKPEPELARKWLNQLRENKRSYRLSLRLLGYFLGAFGFGLFFGGTLLDAFWGGALGVLVGLVTTFFDSIKANQFFCTIAASFLMALCAYSIGALNLTTSADSVIIGALMILVPGLLFTNAMRDIIYGDTNSGVNRIVQVFLVAAALALGTAAAWKMSDFLWGTPDDGYSLNPGFLMQNVACLIGCVGFSILFNIHEKGIVFCAVGGVLTWSVYLVVIHFTGDDIAAHFWASLFAGFYSEIMARIRKKPAIAYLVVSIFPLLPGAGVYYTMNYAVRGNMDQFAQTGMHTAAVAGIMAVGILLASTSVRMIQVWKTQRKR